MEQVKMNRFLVVGLMSIVLLSSCGSLTKMRYSRGFKPNFELTLRKKESAREELKANKAVKKQSDKSTFFDSTNHYSYFTSSNDTTNSGITFIETSESVILKKERTHGGLLKQIPLTLKSKLKTKITKDDRTFEPNAKWGGIIFYSGLALFLIPISISYIAYISFILLLVGFILSIIGLTNIKRSNYTYRGEGLSISVIVLSIIGIILTIIIFALFLAFLLAL